MPKYHINVRTDSHIAQTLDVEQADQTALRIEMAKFVGKLLKDHAELIWADEDWQIDVTDDAGLILYVMHISAMKTPATQGNSSRANPAIRRVCKVHNRLFFKWRHLDGVMGMTAALF